MPRVIKENQIDKMRGLGGMSRLNVVDFAVEAGRIMADARTNANRMIADAQGQAEQINQQASRQGHEQGRKLGYDEGLAKGLIDGQAEGAEKAFNEAMEVFSRQTDDLQTMLKQAVEQLAGAREDILRRARADMLDLAIEIAGKITRIQARGDIEVAKANLAAAIDMVGGRTQLQVSVCSDQLDQLAEYADSLLSDLGGQDAVKFIGDPDLKPGDVVLKSRNGQVDARIETQIERVVNAITGFEGS